MLPRPYRALISHVIAAALAAVVALGLASRTSTGAAGGRLGFFDSRGPSRDAILRAAGGTYIAAVLAERDSVLARWPARTDEPIRVWIEPISIGTFNDRVREAFAEWTDIGLPVRFAFVSQARDAEIVVRWTGRLDHKTGNTVWRVDGDGWLRSGDVILATHTGDGRPLDPRSLRAIALHEIGHVLGLAHSDDRHDVMAPLVRVATLSRGDRATARLLYSLPAGHLR